MGLQDATFRLTQKQKEILDLEKKYFEKLTEVIFGSNFIGDLLLIEKEIRENYQELSELWALKNKLKVSAERLVRHYIYVEWNDIIQSVYPSPVSSDLGIKTDDAVICVDVKTIDIIGNANDLNYTQTEKNQNSFDNKNNPGFEYKCNLKSIDHYSDRPVLTFVVTIAYADDNYSFRLCRDDDKPTIVVACIPNGELSNVFDYNIIENFKTYSYYDESEGAYYTPFEVTIPVSDKTVLKSFLDNEFVNNRRYVDVSVSGRGGRIAYYDPVRHCQWWFVNGRRNKAVCVLKSGSSVRYSNEILKHRYDSHGRPWKGYKTMKLLTILP